MGMGNFLDPGGTAGGLMASGSLANMAVGRITIDTSSIASARQVVVREAKLMGDTLQQVGDRTDQGVTQATGALKRLESGIESARSRASLLMAAFVTGGIAAAQSVKSLEVRMVALSGSEEKAVEHMETLRQQAAAAGQPFLTLVEGATGLLPALRGTNADLGQTVMLAQRLAMMDPAQGVAGASFAIREFLNGEYISLTRRLELDRTRLREILAEADGDAQKAIDGLSRYVDEIGISERQLMEMGKEGVYAFQVLGDEVKQTMADAFTPFLNNALIPIFRTLNDILRVARQINPELLGIAGTAAGLYGTAAVAGRGLPVIGAIPGGGAIAKAGVTAGSLYVGAQAGTGLSRFAGNVGVPGFDRFGGASQSEALGMITDTIKQLGVILLSGFSNIAKHAIMAGFTLRNAFDVVVAVIKWGGAQLAQAFTVALNSVAGAIASYGARLTESTVTRDVGLGLVDAASELFDVGDAVRDLTGNTQEYENTIRHGLSLTIEQQKAYQVASESLDALVVLFAKWTGVLDEGTRSLSAFESQFFSTMVDGINKAFDAIRPPETDLKITDELLGEWSSFQDELADIDRQEKADLLEQQRQYSADVIKENAQYHDAVAQENERHAERIAGIEADYTEARTRAIETRQRREAEIGEELADRLTSIEASHQERAEELVAEYNSRREDAIAEHEERKAQIERQARRDMIMAAMRLDASGVFAARQRLKDQQSDEERAFKKRLGELDKWLSESQAQENKAHEKRIEAAREAADEQLEDLRERYEREEQLARENREARLAELRTQHQRELAEMRTAHMNELTQLRTQHLLRVGEIQRQAAAERQAVNTAFINTFNALQVEAGAHQSAMINIQRMGQAQMEADLRDWWKRMKGVVSDGSAQAPIMPSPDTYVPPGGRYINPFQTGGRAAATGAYRLEQGEYVLRPDVARTIDRMLGGNMTQAALLSAMAGRGARGDITINGMSVPVTLEAGMDARSAAGRVGAEVEQRIFAVLSELLS